MLQLLTKNKKLITYANDFMACLGKLPIHPEFIKHGLTHPMVIELDQWLQSAYQEIKQIDTPLNQLLPKRFLFVKNHVPIIGTLTPSQDKSGRQYPFIMLRFVEHPVAHEFKMIIPTLYNEFYQRADELVQGAEQLTMHTLTQQINQLNKTNTEISRRQGLESAVDVLKTVSYNDFRIGLEACVPGYDESAFFQALKKVLNVACTQLASNKKTSLCFPLPTTKNSLPGVIFWLQLMEARLPIKHHDYYIFWDRQAESDSSRMMIHIGHLPVSTLVQMMGNKVKQEGVLDLSAVKTIQENVPGVKPLNIQEQDPLMRLLHVLSSS